MSKPIKLNDSIITEILEGIKNKLLASVMFDGDVKVSEEYEYKDNYTATIDFTAKAYNQMRALIDAFDSEVGWHGHAVKLDTGKYLIQDIMVYDQVVTGVTVDTDDTEYTLWLHTRDDDDFNRIRFQGHSHVDMAVVPSGTDLNNQKKIMSQLRAGDFYIFGIFNKKGATNLKIYDFDDNILYENKEITVTIDGEPEYMTDFLTQAFEAVEVQKLPKYKGYVNSRSSYYGTDEETGDFDYESYKKYGIF